MDRESLASRFVGLRPVVEEILQISGAVGLSYGIIHHGQIIHTESFGYRDYEQKLPVDSQTMFSICSMTKGLVSSALALLVNKGQLQWNSRVCELLPWFSPQSDTLREKGTLIDFLAMRSGIERYSNWPQSYNRMNFTPSQSQKVINSLQMTSDLRWKYSYNNWSYEIAGHVCKEVGGESWDSMLHSKFFEPLALKRTDATGRREHFDNVAKAYMVLDDRKPVTIPRANLSGQTVMGAAGGVESCIDDLLILYQSILQAVKAQSVANNKTTTEENPFQLLGDIVSAHMPFPVPSLYESSYALGWMRTQLPNQMSKISTNYALLGDQPLIGEGAPSRLMLAHHGRLPGSFAGVNLFPDSESAVVMLSNTTALCDLADWITQLLTQVLFDFPNKVDLVPWIQKTADAELAWHARVSADLDAYRNGGDVLMCKLSDYVGTYVNTAETFFMEIREERDNTTGGKVRLELLFECRDDECFPLEYLCDNTFSWLPQSRNELVSRGRVALRPATYYMIRFERDQEGGDGGGGGGSSSGSKMDSLFWTHDPKLPMGEKYVRNENGKEEIERLIQRTD